MATVTIKNLPDDLYELIKKNAASNYRSINGEIIFRLERSLKHKEEDVDKLLQRIENLQKTVRVPELTQDVLEKARETGRP